MNYRGLSLPDAAAVPFPSVIAYLESSGWSRVHGLKNKSIAVLRKGGAEEQEVVVPLDHGFSDYAYRICDVAAAVAALESRNATEVLVDLLLPASDTVRFSIAGPVAELGTLPLESGLAFLQAARRALASAACSVLRPQQTFFPRMSFNQVDQLLSACRIGTEKGSFVARLVCPLDAVPADDGGSESGADSFARKTTRSLYRSISSLVEAIREGELDDLGTDDEGKPLGVTANLCEALTAMQMAGDRANLTVSTSWSRSVPEPQIPTTSIVVQADYLPTLEGLSQRLRPREVPRRQFFVGVVDTLNGTPGPDGRREGEVILTCLLTDGEQEVPKVRVDLRADDYQTAIRAHEENRYVQVTGTLRRGSRVHRLLEYETFELHPSSVTP